jgi:diguanylate cyclase (GGDEF)-like protein
MRSDRPAPANVAAPKPIAAIVVLIGTSVVMLTAALLLAARGLRATDAADAARVAQLDALRAGSVSAVSEDDVLRQRRDARAAMLGAGGLALTLLAGMSVFALFALLNNAQLRHRVRELSRTDGLTGVANRLAWEERFGRELAQSKRLGYPVTMALMDIDRFDAYAVAHGHGAADRLLADAAKAWGGTLRRGDLLARYSMHQFALLLPGCPIEQAGLTVERLRALTPHGQSISAGVACWHWRETPEMLLERATTALALAREQGAARTEVSSSPPPNVDRPAHRRGSFRVAEAA